MHVECVSIAELFSSAIVQFLVWSMLRSIKLCKHTLKSPVVAASKSSWLFPYLTVNLVILRYSFEISNGYKGILNMINSLLCCTPDRPCPRTDCVQQTATCLFKSTLADEAVIWRWNQERSALNEVITKAARKSSFCCQRQNRFSVANEFGLWQVQRLFANDELRGEWPGKPLWRCQEATRHAVVSSWLATQWLVQIRMTFRVFTFAPTLSNARVVRKIVAWRRQWINGR